MRRTRLIFAPSFLESSHSRKYLSAGVKPKSASGIGMIKSIRDKLQAPVRLALGPSVGLISKRFAARLLIVVLFAALPICQHSIWPDIHRPVRRECGQLFRVGSASPGKV